MSFIDKSDIKDLYEDSIKEARIWREDYNEFERLADNDLMEGLDENLPEVNDGSLSAALFKLPKRVVSSKLSGTVKALDRDEAWMNVLANIVWTNYIIPFANSQAPFHRKWKDAVRKAAIYGSVPIITLFVETEGKRHADFIVAQPQDVTLEPGKVSDYDSSVMFWDVYYTKQQLKTMIEQAKEENKSQTEGYNKWDVKALEEILKDKQTDERPPQDQPLAYEGKDVKPKGYKFCIVAQRGVEAPFYMYYSGTKKTVREWTNPDPTGDTMVHFLYCYQDMINPYGIGIVKLAGGTQNVLDYMRQADVLATQLGLRPPLNIQGDTNELDWESLVYAQDAQWVTGNAVVKREEMSTQVYQSLPDRMAMYKTSLNQLIPTGDTSIASGSGDPQYSKTPAGVKFQAAALSIDDEDVKDNLYITYAAVAKNMINTHFANMEGEDLFKLNDDERESLIKAGFDWPQDEEGNMGNELQVKWDDVRATFDFEVDPEQDKAADDQTKIDGLTKTLELIATDPNLMQELAQVNKKLNKGELYAELISLTTDNDKIITDIGPEDEEQQMMQQEGQAPDPQIELTQQKMAQDQEKHQLDMQAKQQDMDMKAETTAQKMQSDAMKNMAEPSGVPQGQPEPPQDIEGDPEEIQANMEAVMQEHGVDEDTALMMLAAEAQGMDPQAILEYVQGQQQ